MRGKAQIIVKSFTWQRDSHGLFDYECKTLTKKSLKATQSSILTRNGNDVHVNKDWEKKINPKESDLLKLHVKDGNFWIAAC
mmetsp:Transcript_10129/g.8652  ORF Transcript_10129/g.8652 Transcript_10129/m.8652 type:complete len:82 (+) Transcript_10129:113-358(+)